MIGLIIGLAILLTLVILYLLFRVGNLTSVIRQKKEEKEGMNTNHGLYFLIFMVVSLTAFFVYSIQHYEEYKLPIASQHGEAVDRLFWITMGITVAAFVIISIVMFWFTYAYRYREGRRAHFFADNNYLELLWTIIPAIVLALLVFGGLRQWSQITSAASQDAEIIEIVGQQFFWTVRYPGADNQLGHHDFRMIDPVNEFGLDLTDKNSYDDFKSLELHLPKGREVLLKIRAKDVIHSVFLPHFRVKMDAVPGMQTMFKFIPTKSTADMREETGNSSFNYEMACTEICGKGHFSMRLLVLVEEPDEYEDWKKQQVSWLKQNPEYVRRIPESLRQTAREKSGLLEDKTSYVEMTEDLVN